MSWIGRCLIVLGLLIVALGCAVLAGRLNLPFGKLPGDITWHGKNSVVYFPITTSIIVSIVLSLILYLISRFRR
jgi:heme/copper-type cytochrome/quinol oxidase subunit 2